MTTIELSALQTQEADVSEVSAPSGFSSAVVHVTAELSWSTSARPPIAIPESQLYYWTRVWQANENEAVQELASGKGFEFDSPDDAIHWLLSEDED